LENLAIDGENNITKGLKENFGSAWTGLIWLRIWKGGGLCCTWRLTHRFAYNAGGGDFLTS